MTEAEAFAHPEFIALVAGLEGADGQTGKLVLADWLDERGLPLQGMAMRWAAKWGREPSESILSDVPPYHWYFVELGSMVRSQVKNILPFACFFTREGLTIRPNRVSDNRFDFYSFISAWIFFIQSYSLLVQELTSTTW